MNDITNKFFLYARKSTDEPDRQVRSIDDQLVEVQQLAAERNIQIVEVVIEKQSAKQPGRPLFNQMMERIERGEANGILSWHADRLARNSLDGGRIIYCLDTGKLTQLIFKDSTVDPTSHGKLMLAISFGMSKYHSDNFSDGIKRVQRRKVAEGLWPQTPPLGYLFDPVTRGIAPDPERAPLVRKVFELYAAGGYTLVRLRSTINALGLTNRLHRNGTGGGPLAVSQYQLILTNPIYYGVMRFTGELHPGKHEPLITKHLFDAAQEILQCRSKPNVQGPVSCLYRGTFRCGECGASITSEIQKGHEYLRCTKKLRPCSQRYVRIEEITRQVAEQVHRFAVPDPLADSMIRELSREAKDHVRAQGETLARLRDKIKSVDDRLKRLLNLHVEQTISLEEYRTERNHLVGQRRQLDDDLITLETTGSSWLEPAIAFIQAAKSTVFSQYTKTDVQKRDFLKTAGSNLLIKDRTIHLVPRGPWKTVVDSHGFWFVSAAAPVPRGQIRSRRPEPAFVPAVGQGPNLFKDKPRENAGSLSVQALPIPLLV